MPKESGLSQEEMRDIEELAWKQYQSLPFVRRVDLITARFFFTVLILLWLVSIYLTRNERINSVFIVLSFITFTIGATNEGYKNGFQSGFVAGQKYKKGQK